MDISIDINLVFLFSQNSINFFLFDRDPLFTGALIVKALFFMGFTFYELINDKNG